MTTESVFAMPISRTELYQRVNDAFYERFPAAPKQLKADSDPKWRAWWVEERDRQLNEEVNRVYWARYPQAPVQLDETSPEWEMWRQSWNRIREEVLENAPALEDVEITNAVDEHGVLDLTHLRASIREQLVDLKDQIDPDKFDEVVAACDLLAEEVGAKAMLPDAGIHGQWESKEVRITGRGEWHIDCTVTGMWGDHGFTGWLSATIHRADQAWEIM